MILSCVDIVSLSSFRQMPLHALSCPDLSCSMHPNVFDCAISLHLSSIVVLLLKGYTTPAPCFVMTVVLAVFHDKREYVCV